MVVVVVVVIIQVLVFLVSAVNSWLSSHAASPVPGAHENFNPQNPGKPFVWCLLGSNYCWAHPDLGGGDSHPLHHLLQKKHQESVTCAISLALGLTIRCLCNSKEFFPF